MQPTPIRLSQAIWAAFRAAKPARPSPICQRINYHQQRSPLTSRRKCAPTWTTHIQSQARFYSSDKQTPDIEKKVEEVKDRIDESLDSRAAAAADAEPTLKHTQHETIVHTLPESSSIVHPREDQAKKSNRQDADASHKSDSKPSDPSAASAPDMPSQIAQFRSNLLHRFSHFMDNFQSQVFVASRRINDLTGYTGIERLKREIETQEATVQSSRQLVKSSRAKYSEAIAMRSATQREVNDLLHRKHAWSAQDLERFTGLYRSDHANEQAEQKAHQALSDAEMQYEEASTKLAKGILARYHEEQIWSDKIRQMSTWGTWGLMGLNVLLFVLLQLAIEPWRRRRLVRGFEEKVEAALAAREQDSEILREVLRTRPGNDVVQNAVELKSEDSVAVAGEQLAEAVVDAITGSTAESTTDGPLDVTMKEDIEAAAETVTMQELQNESNTAEQIVQIAESVPEGGSPDILPDLEATDDSSATTTVTDEIPSPIPSIFDSTWAELPSSVYASVQQSYVHYKRILSNQFSKNDHIVLSHQELTTRILEGVAAGAALAGGILFVIVRTR